MNKKMITLDKKKPKEHQYNTRACNWLDAIILQKNHNEIYKKNFKLLKAHKYNFYTKLLKQLNIKDKLKELNIFYFFNLNDSKTLLK